MRRIDRDAGGSEVFLHQRGALVGREFARVMLVAL